ncbi:MAG: T9SS type A sorting domain-containing protein [Muribaculaceae bacterium]|nr:T9SS type A sorting domain-containing protein [Muribaculaceae bacterium]
MKKFTLIAAAAFMAMAANAQYTCEPGTENVLTKKPTNVDYIILSDEAIAAFSSAGAKMQYVGPSPDEGRNLWYWNGFNAGSDAYPRVDFDNGGYTSVEVNGEGGWSGAGFAINGPLQETKGPGVNLSHLNENSVFHMAYMSPTNNAPASIACIVLDDAGNGSQPAKFALGDAFNDGGVIFPAIGPKAGDDWQGLEITLGQLKKLWPTFNLTNAAAWGGNIFSFLGGAVAGQTFAFDAMYFYTPAGAGSINEVGADSNVEFIVTPNTVNVAGANGIVLYNISGAVVKSTAGTTLGINGLPAGVYVAKAAGKTCKVVVK